MIRSVTGSEELKIRTIAVSKLLNLAVHWSSKVWPVGMIARKVCSTIERNLYNSLHHGTIRSKKYLNLVFYDNRNLEISKSKKSERYFRDKIEIFIRLDSMNTLLAILKVADARRDVILVGGLYHRFPWRHLPPLDNTMLRTSTKSHFRWSQIIFYETFRFLCALHDPSGIRFNIFTNPIYFISFSRKIRYLCLEVSWDSAPP